MCGIVCIIGVCQYLVAPQRGFEPRRLRPSPAASTPTSGSAICSCSDRLLYPERTTNSLYDVCVCTYLVVMVTKLELLGYSVSLVSFSLYNYFRIRNLPATL